MLRVVGARLLDAVPTVLLVLTLVFIALRLLPGDPALVALGDYATPEQLALFREQMGLNVPLWQQYFLFIWDMLTLDFGQSLIDRRPVLQLLADNLPYTIELTLVATGMGLFIGVPLGVIAAVNRNRLPDAGVRVFSLVGYAVPDFYLGALLLIVFALNLGWFPINGGGTGFIDRMHHVFLPAVTLAMVKTAFLGRLTRTSLLEVLGKDYIRTARARERGRTASFTGMDCATPCCRSSRDWDSASLRPCPARSRSSSSSTGQASARSSSARSPSGTIRSFRPASWFSPSSSFWSTC